MSLLRPKYVSIKQFNHPIGAQDYSRKVVHDVMINGLPWLRVEHTVMVS
jgi:hypothetical protein